MLPREQLLVGSVHFLHAEKRSGNCLDAARPRYELHHSMSDPESSGFMARNGSSADRFADAECDTRGNFLAANICGQT